MVLYQGTFYIYITMIKELAYRNRSYRRFYEEQLVEKETLVDLVDLARVAASGKNLQSLKYFVVNDKFTNHKVFTTLAWAGYLKEWDGPVAGERPSAYIVILEDTSIGTGMVHDQGLAAQNILLGAVEKGLGGCIIASVKRPQLAAILNLPSHLTITLVIALGKPKEEVVIDPIKDNDIKYWRDEDHVHHVPKRSLEEIIINW